ncbi:hypothetical protein [Brevundimonas sp.]|uniref:DUF7946 domain-containing protein n=1 Tax=Brevundimonas sp. TaxID=1871086 RepID=UPI0028AB547B|nr:hypothetical protein [Brevundimonas sp.]
MSQDLRASEIRFKIQYQGGKADDHALPGYDGATSIDGITRAFHIALNAYMTGEVSTRATVLNNAKIYIKPPKKGSFVFELICLIEAYPATSSVISAVAAPAIYDFIKTAFNRATGKQDAEPENTTLAKIYNAKSPPPGKVEPADLDYLAEVLEGSLQDGHRVIGEDGVQKIQISAPRSVLLEFTPETKEWVNTQEESRVTETLHGNVTRYNSISRNGRAYIEELERVVPFRPNGDFPAAEFAYLTWSLHGSNTGAAKRLALSVRRVTSASGKVKRLLLSDCSRA